MEILKQPENIHFPGVWAGSPLRAPEWPGHLQQEPSLLVPTVPRENLVMQIVPKEVGQVYQLGSLLRPWSLLAVQPQARLWTSLGFYQKT